MAAADRVRPRTRLLQAAQVRNLGARIVVAEESSHLVPFQQPEVIVAAVTDVRVLTLPGTLFWSRIARIPGVMRNLLASLSARMRRANETM